ncbi:hypothetical protein ART_3966 [Arthrobacter sp. PAMC 25486]|uniref:DUF5719 family protein n=1 Tax=Arthrobacter sp. PAMC 25486 TaxID=1494608 RepID=UPI000535CED6|nr:DUF5719 family protein [Arthrobacter sp. PAMC 25486]AIY03565.1 hypothetical protein ART_3966 [Arthrobacter sp. PAMC 25486]
MNDKPDNSDKPDFTGNDAVTNDIDTAQDHAGQKHAAQTAGPAAAAGAPAKADMSDAKPAAAKADAEAKPAKASAMPAAAKADVEAKPAKASAMPAAAKADVSDAMPAPAKPAAAEATPGKGKARRAKGARREKARVRRRWPAVVAGTATLALAAAAVGAGTLFPGANATAQTELVPHLLPVGDAMANCQGPTQLLAGSAEGADPEFSASSSSTKARLDAVVLSSAKGDLPAAAVQSLDGSLSPLFTVSEASAATEATPATVTGEPKMRAKVLRGQDAGAPSALRIAPQGEEVPQGSASVVVAADDGDLSGLAAATCQTPSNELWLSGASTSIGRTAVLSLANSSASPATVSLDLYSGQGPVQTAGGKGLAVAPGAVKQVVLAGLAPDQELLSVHVKSVGGAVSAVIQQSILRGLTPGGIDYLAPVQAPATTLSIPGVRVQAPDVAAKISAQDGYADASTAMVITVPGARDAVVEVKAYGPKGQVALPDGGVFTAAAGTASSMALTGLPEGNYSFSVSSDESVTATVRMVNSTKPGDAVDVAFAPSTARLGGSHLLSLTQDASSTLVFTAPEGSATVRLVPIAGNGELGAAKDIELNQGSTSSIDPRALLGDKTAAVLVSVAGAPTFGSQLLGSKDSADVAVLPIPGTTAGSHSMTIVTGY